MNINQLNWKLRCAALTFLFAAGFRAASADSYIWQGGSGNAWSTAANWYDVTTSATALTAPASTDDVTFDVSSSHYVTGAPVLDAGDAAKSLTIASGSTITTSSGYGLTVSGSITGAGTLNLSAFSGTVTVSGDITVATLVPGTTSTIVLNGTSAQNLGSNTYYNLTISNTSANITTSGDIFINGTLTVNASTNLVPGASYIVGGGGTLTGSGTIYVTAAGNTDDYATQYVTSTITLTNLKVNFGGTAAQAISSSISPKGFVISNTGATVTFNADETPGSSGTSVSSGAVLAVNSANTLSGGVTGSGTILVSHTGDASDDMTAQYTGTITFTNLTVTYDGSADQMIGTHTFGKLTINSGHTATLSGDIVVSSDLTITSGTLDVSSSNYAIEADGNFTNNGTFTPGAGTVTFNGTALQTIGPNTFNNVTISNTNPGVTVSGDITINGTLAGIGKFNASSRNITINTDMTVITFICGTSKIILSGSGTQNIGAYTFYNLEVDNGGVVLANPEIINGNLTGSATLSGVSAGSISLAGNMTIAGFTANTSAMILNGSSNQNINGYTFYDLTLNNTAGATLNGDVTISDVLNLNNGILTLGTHILTISLTSGGITGSFGPTRYIRTNSTGYLRMTATTSGTLFPIGDAYNPITITAQSLNAIYEASVLNGVTDAYFASVANHGVNVTWKILPEASTQSVTVIPQWIGSQELPSFDRSQSYVSYRTSLTNPSLWHVTEAEGAAGGSDPYTRVSGIFSTIVDTAYYIAIGSDSLSVLPVTLTQFTAQYVNSMVNLDWQTASEINNAYFEVQRSADGQEWMPIAHIEGHGNSQTLINYHAVDNLAGVIPTGTLYYRLKQVDYNGAFVYSQIRSVNIANAQAELNTWPNPASDVLNYTWTSETNDPAIVTIKDLSGRQLYTSEIEGQGMTNRQIDLSGLQPGTYYLQIVSNGSMVSRLILKNGN